MKRLALVLVFLAALTLSACGSAAAPSGGDSIQVTDAWVRLVPSTDGMGMGGSNGAMYMLISNSAAQADTLLRVETGSADMAQVHLTETDASGLTSMHEVDGVDVPAGGSVEFKPGGYHVMLMGLKPEVKPGTTASFTLYFKNAGAVTVEAAVKTP